MNGNLTSRHIQFLKHDLPENAVIDEGDEYVVSQAPGSANLVVEEVQDPMPGGVQTRCMKKRSSYAAMLSLGKF